MKVRLDLAGELDGEIDSALVDGYSIGDGATLAELVSSMPFAERIALTSVNGEMVPPDSRASRVLRDGDEVMLLPAVKGG
jgi:thiamine biosynthesis protein ThiS